VQLSQGFPASLTMADDRHCQRLSGSQIKVHCT